jgi:hypothetical protein
LQLDKVITAEDRKMRLPWWGVLCVILGGLPVLILFDYFGKFNLARPTLTSAVVVVVAIALRWKLKGHVWFWITMTILAALHVLIGWGEASDIAEGGFECQRGGASDAWQRHQQAHLRVRVGRACDSSTACGPG